MARKRVILADDHRMFAEGVKRALDADYDVVTIAENGQQCFEAVVEHKPHIVIADISMPGLNGIECARRIRERSPQTKVILLTMHEDPVYAAAALDEGVSGFVLKNAPFAELHRAVRDALDDNVYVAPSISRMVFQLQRRRDETPAQNSEPLTRTQRDILRLLAEGKTTKQIAAAMAMSGKGVEYHKYKMMRQLGVKTTAELVRYAARVGIITT